MGEQNYSASDLRTWMLEAISLSRNGVERNEGGPFGAVVVKDGLVVGRGNNRVTSSNDPTAHAEVVAIRDACSNLGTFDLSDCILLTSCEPCPMCLGAIYWSRVKEVFYANDRFDAAKIGFDDEFFYVELDKEMKDRSITFTQVEKDEAIKVFELWEQKSDKKKY